jgi:hypothetical protein
MLCLLAAVVATVSVAAHTADRHVDSQGRQMSAAVGRQHRTALFFPHAGTDTTQHFYLYDDGGAMDFSVPAPVHADADAVQALQAHLTLMAPRFGRGDFSPQGGGHGSGHATGVDELTRLRTDIQYTVVRTDAGGRIDIRTASAEALVAVHAFLRFHIIDLATGDSPDVVVR